MRNVGFRCGNESANLCQTEPPRSHRVIGAGDSTPRGDSTEAQTHRPDRLLYKYAGDADVGLTA